MKRLRALVRRRGRERGAAAVEMALVLPVLALLIFGVIDYGRLHNTQISLTEAAREGSRVFALTAAADDPDEAAEDRVKSVLTCAAAAPPTCTVTVLAGTCTSPCDPDDDPAPGACPTDADPDVVAKVKVTYNFEFITPVPGIAALYGGTMSSTKSLTAVGIMSCRT